MPSSTDERAIEFLLESNAIEEITEVDYRLPRLRIEGRGHWGAFLRMQALVASREPLTLDELATWQRLICAEQVEHGHALPQAYIGELRGPGNPVDVRVGSHIAPDHTQVGGLMRDWIADANRQAYSDEWSDPAVVQAVADPFQRFEAIHPFADGNGRVGRLVANWLGLAHQLALIVFRASERPVYYPAHRSRRAMRVFIAAKSREALSEPDGLLPRIHAEPYSDAYGRDGKVTMIIERHELMEAVKIWQREDEERHGALPQLGARG
jgi:hypothetical protein